MKHMLAGKWMKATKRLLSYSLLEKDTSMNSHSLRAELYGIVHSGLGIMYECSATLSCVAFVLGQPRPPMDLVKEQLDAIRWRLGGIADQGKAYARVEDEWFKRLDALRARPSTEKAEELAQEVGAYVDSQVKNVFPARHKP